jgi:hypothetical protein
VTSFCCLLLQVLGDISPVPGFDLVVSNLKLSYAADTKTLQGTADSARLLGAYNMSVTASLNPSNNSLALVMTTLPAKDITVDALLLKLFKNATEESAAAVAPGLYYKRVTLTYRNTRDPKTRWSIDAEPDLEAGSPDGAQSILYSILYHEICLCSRCSSSLHLITLPMHKHTKCLTLIYFVAEFHLCSRCSSHLHLRRLQCTSRKYPLSLHHRAIPAESSVLRTRPPASARQPSKHLKHCDNYRSAFSHTPLHLTYIPTLPVPCSHVNVSIAGKNDFGAQISALVNETDPSLDLKNGVRLWQNGFNVTLGIRKAWVVSLPDPFTNNTGVVQLFVGLEKLASPRIVLRTSFFTGENACVTIVITKTSCFFDELDFLCCAAAVKSYIVTLVDATQLEPFQQGNQLTKRQNRNGWEGRVSQSDKTGT